MNSTLESIARVQIELGNNKTRSGTAFAISENLALTAMHVVKAKGSNPPSCCTEEILLIFPKFQVAATPVAWNVSDDWALLKFDGDVPPLIMGLIPEFGAKWKSIGWPKLQPVDAFSVQGEVTESHAKLQGRPSIQLFCKEATGDIQTMSGLSGAPVISSGKVFGIIRAELSGEKKKSILAATLYATPLSEIIKSYKDTIPPLVISKPNVSISLNTWIDEIERISKKKISDRIITDQIRSIESSYGTNPPKHKIIVGAMGTGKTTVSTYIAQNFSSSYSTVVALPLNPSLYNSETWKKPERIKHFSSILRTASRQQFHKTLFLIEDAHELKELPATLMSDDEPFNASSCSLLVTTRPESLEIVKGILKSSWGIENCEIIWIDPDSTAEAIVKSGIDSEYSSEPFMRLYRSGGRNLIILNAILVGWRNDKNASKGPTMNHAYSAVYYEIERIVSDYNQPGLRDTHEVSLALLWMLGGLEIKIQSDFFHEYFNFRPDSKFWEYLYKHDEISLSENQINSIRHPAWGHLVIVAIDEFKLFSHVRKQIIAGFKDRIIEDTPSVSDREDIIDQIQLMKPSVCVLSSLLLARVIEPTELCKYATGKHIHDEYLKATDLVTMIWELSETHDLLELSEIRLSAADSVRRSGTDPVQRQQLLVDGQSLLQSAFDDRKTFLDGKPDPKQGYLLYNFGYYNYLTGKLTTAAEQFNRSAIVEFVSTLTEMPKRRPFAAMSMVMSARSYLAMTDISSARETIRWASSLLKDKSEDISDQDYFRFLANIHHVFFSIALAENNITEAKDQISQYFSYSVKGGIEPIDKLCYARLELAKRNGKEAEIFIRQTIANNPLMTSAEVFTSAYRILGDALLLQGKKEDAIDNYKKTLPPPDSSKQLLDPEMSAAKERINNIESGISIQDIFIQP